MKTSLFITTLIATVMFTSGCIEHRVKADPIEVKPIHITVDVNVRVDRELDEFFSYEKESDGRNPQ